ncbi:MAG: hypothetical protein AAF530_12840 [Pseudomonadota bacterium]
MTVPSKKANQGAVRSHPPVRLGDRVKKGAGPDLRSILARVERGIEAMRGEFDGELKASVVKIGKAGEAFTTQLGAVGNATESQLYLLVHDLRGQAGTFDYHLVSTIGSMLCSYLEQWGKDSPASAAKKGAAPNPIVIQAHIDALRAISLGGITGDGGDVGEDLVRSLEQLRAKKGKISASRD